MKKNPLIVIAILFSLTSIAQENIALSLEQAIAYGLKNSYRTINAQRDIDAAKYKKWETTTIGLPQISATLDYQNWIKKQVVLLPTEFFGGNAGEFAAVPFGLKHTLTGTATLKSINF